ncbi:MAG TPA: hypothetical protein ENK24_02435 [Anaerolineae bacterium]|nr:hypothetical protein [Anaerolineae bacterium]
MKRSKKILAAVLSLIVLLSLACGLTGGDSSQSQLGGVAPAQGAGQAAMPPAQNGEIQTFQAETGQAAMPPAQSGGGQAMPPAQSGAVAQPQTGGGSAAYPTLNDADVQVNTTGLLNYYTNTGVNEAAAFYKRQLSAAGWTSDASLEIVMEDNAILTFEKGGAELSVLINKEDDGRVNVTVMAGQ